MDLGRKKMNDYEIIREIGAGIYGKVMLCEKDGTEYAMKILHKNKLRKAPRHRPSSYIIDQSKTSLSFSWT